MEGGVALPRAGDPPRPPQALAEEKRPSVQVTMPTPSLPGMQSAPPKAPMMRPMQPGDGTPSLGMPFWFPPGSFALTASASSDAIGKLNPGMLAEPKLVSSIPLLPRPPMSGEAPAPHEDYIRMIPPAPPVNNQFAMMEPGSAIFHFPSHRLLNCNSRFHRLLEEMGCPMRMGIHWQDLLNSPAMKDVNVGTQGRIEKFAEQCVAPKQRHGGPPPQQFVIQAKPTGSSPPRNFFLTIVPLQQFGADWALAMWVLEYMNEPLTPVSAPTQARPPSHAVAAPAPVSATTSAPPGSAAEHGNSAKRIDSRKSTEELQVLADKAERKRKEKPWVAATMKWNMKVKKGGKPE